ncbi:tetratricopeptide repeat protein [Alphaproteobacteria bacterium]|nr:tetratricopeptide repeat protein [Alphaproteobacteria bacterium]
MLNKLSLENTFLKAKSFENKKEYLEAKKIYQDILNVFPLNIRAKERLESLTKDLQNPPKKEINQLVTYLDQKKFLSVVKYAQNLIENYPDAFLVYNSLGLALYHLKKSDHALLMFKKAFIIKPDYVDPYYNIGNVFQSENNLSESIKFYNKALTLDPRNSNALYKKGIALFKQGRLDQSIEAYKACVSLAPNFAQAYNNMGICLYNQNKLKEALISYNKSLSINSEYANALYNKSIALYESGEEEKAINTCKKSILINSSYVEAYNKLGDFYQNQGHLNTAIEYYNKAIFINPNYIDSYNNKGVALDKQYKFNEAIEVFKKSISLSPNQPMVYQNLSFALLQAGKIKEGLEKYEWRWKTSKFLSTKRHFPQPYWDGKKSLNGKKILVWSEQGIGDTLRWSSCLTLLSSLAEKCILECQPKLVPLLKRSFPNIEVRPNDRKADLVRKDFDFHLPMGSLYKCFLDDIINKTKPESYLIPDPNRVVFWRERLNSLGNGPYVGITWQSSLLDTERNKKYSSISEWGPILKVKGITFINLQVKNFDDDLIKARNEFGVEIYNLKDLDQYDNIDDTSAFFSALDMVISHCHSPYLISSAVGTHTKLATIKQNTSVNNFLYAPVSSKVEIFLKDADDMWEDIFSLIGKDLIKLKQKTNY